MRASAAAFVAVVAAALSVPATAGAGGIADEPCPNVAGEYTNTCPSGTVGTPYSMTFVETEGSGCGPGRQTFHIDSGLAPPGLTLAPDGALSGTPQRVGTYRFYVQMREPEDDPATCAGKRTEKQFTLRVRNPLAVTTPAARLLVTEVGAAPRLALRARGGSGVYAWRITDGALPLGLRLARRGTLLGAPRRAGAFTFTVRAQDTEFRTEAWTGTLRVAPRLRLCTDALEPARIGRLYRVRVRAAGGVGTRVWSLARGRLPRGLALVRTRGLIAGRPAESGRFRVTVAVRDGLRVRSSRTFALTVLGVPKRRPGLYEHVS